jgi:hypothetical protein
MNEEEFRDFAREKNYCKVGFLEVDMERKRKCIFKNIPCYLSP